MSALPARFSFPAMCKRAAYGEHKNSVAHATVARALLTRMGLPKSFTMFMTLMQ